MKANRVPGHFDGVLTIVKRYFELIKPQVAIFGEKDWQQLALINEMMRTYAHNIKIISVPTVREESGLAFSSRNKLLSTVGKKAAAKIYEALLIASNEKSNTKCEQTFKAFISDEKFFTLDYVQVIDSITFTPSENGDRIIVAGWIEGVRLIDNISLENIEILPQKTGNLTNTQLPVKAGNNIKPVTCYTGNIVKEESLEIARNQSNENASKASDNK